MGPDRVPFKTTALRTRTRAKFGRESATDRANMAMAAGHPHDEPARRLERPAASRAAAGR